MSEEERIWADTLADAVEPANEYARRIRRKYMVSDRNDRYGVDHTLNIIGQAFLAGVEYQPARDHDGERRHDDRGGRRGPPIGKRAPGRAAAR